MYPIKLIVLLPEKKPPFVGVVFTDTSEIKSLYQDLVLNHKYAGYRLVFEHINGLVNLSLISERALVVKFYNKLKYDAEKLEAWYYLTKQFKMINFSHLTERYDKLEVVRTDTYKRPFVLPVQSYEVFKMEERGLIKKKKGNGTTTIEDRLNKD